MNAAAPPLARRTVRYAALSEFLEDAERIAAGSHATAGQWSYAQILEHLARVMECSIDGFDGQASWFLRWIVAPFIRNSTLIQPMQPGFQLPKAAAALVPAADTALDEALRHARIAVERLDREEPTARHPVFGAMATEEWTQLHLRHAELHMSFVVPTP